MTASLLLPIVTTLLPPSAMCLGPSGGTRATPDWPRGSQVIPSEESNPGLSPYQKLLDSPILTSGDVAALLTFAAIGRGNHGAEDGSLIRTAAPFLVAWLVVAPVLGAYDGPGSAATIGERLRAPLPAIAAGVPSLLVAVHSAAFWGTSCQPCRAG